MVQENEPKTYSTSVITNTLGISRGTLRYYEQLGILSPTRTPGSNYRTYSNMDVFRAVKSTLLKNSGLQLQQVKATLDAAPEDFVRVCLEQADAERRRAEAIEERLRALEHAVACDGDEPHLARAPTWLLYYDGAEKGYNNFEADNAQDSLIDGMPLSSFAAVMDIDVFAPGTERPTRWGRTVMADYADLVPALDSSHREPTQLGGRPCVTLVYSADQDKIPGFDPTGATCARIAEFVRARGLRPDGPLFAPDVLPVGSKVYCNLYLPVAAANLWGRMALARCRR